VRSSGWPCVRDRAAEPFHHRDEAIEFGIGLDALGQRFREQFSIFGGAQGSTIFSIPPDHIACEVSNALT